jgi:hypothetical protein
MGSPARSACASGPLRARLGHAGWRGKLAKGAGRWRLLAMLLSVVRGSASNQRTRGNGLPVYSHARVQQLTTLAEQRIKSPLVHAHAESSADKLNGNDAVRIARAKRDVEHLLRWAGWSRCEAKVDTGAAMRWSATAGGTKSVGGGTPEPHCGGTRKNEFEAQCETAAQQRRNQL